MDDVKYTAVIIENRFGKYDVKIKRNGRMMMDNDGIHYLHTKTLRSQERAEKWARKRMAILRQIDKETLAKDKDARRRFSEAIVLEG